MHGRNILQRKKDASAFKRMIMHFLYMCYHWHFIHISQGSSDTTNQQIGWSHPVFGNQIAAHAKFKDN